MDEKTVRGIVRSEIEEMLLDDTLGQHIRTVVVNALKQIGIEDLLQINAGTRKAN